MTKRQLRHSLRSQHYTCGSREECSCSCRRSLIFITSRSRCQCVTNFRWAVSLSGFSERFC